MVHITREWRDNQYSSIINLLSSSYFPSISPPNSLTPFHTTSTSFSPVGQCIIVTIITSSLYHHFPHDHFYPFLAFPPLTFFIAPARPLFTVPARGFPTLAAALRSLEMAAFPFPLRCTNCSVGASGIIPS